MLLYATCVAIDGQAVLLGGVPGVGKSNLALQLIDQGALLVADDQTKLSVQQGVVVASPPPSIAGVIEIRHIGLLRMAFVTDVTVVLYVELVEPDEKLERLPTPDVIFLLDQPVQRLRLSALGCSTPAKIRAALLYPRIDD